MAMVAEAGKDVLVLVIMVNSESAIHELIEMLERYSCGLDIGKSTLVDCRINVGQLTQSRLSTQHNLAKGTTA